VTMTITAMADFGGATYPPCQNEYLSAYLNGVFAANYFSLEGNHCPTTPDVLQRSIPPAVFNSAAATESWSSILSQARRWVIFECGSRPTFVQVRLDYPRPETANATACSMSAICGTARARTSTATAFRMSAIRTANANGVPDDVDLAAGPARTATPTPSGRVRPGRGSGWRHRPVR